MVKNQLLHKHLDFIRAIAYDSTGKLCSQASFSFPFLRKEPTSLPMCAVLFVFSL